MAERVKQKCIIQNTTTGKYAYHRGCAGGWAAYQTDNFHQAHVYSDMSVARCQITQMKMEGWVILPVEIVLKQ